MRHALALLLLLPASALWAQQASPARVQIYRWVDASGQAHYGDVTSAPRGAKPVHAHVPQPNPSSALPAPSAPSADPASPPPAGDDLEQVRKSCQVAQRNEQLLADPARQVLNDAGTQVMDPAQRAQRLALVQRQVQAYCQVLGSDPGAAGTQE